MWDLDRPEYDLCFRLVREIHSILSERFKADGFNVGINCGEATGQTVSRAHIHVIPRYTGDTPNLRGGVRHVMLLNGNY